MSQYDEEYDGPATLTEGTESTPIAATVRLRGHLDPVDGAFHWYGRLDSDASAGLRNGITVRIATAQGAATGRISDLDPWGRYRISGTGQPPF